jgi:DNA-directed RNA polymerase subunit RPC12/RpoP
MARSGSKPGRGVYECSKCGAHQEIKTGASTLKRCSDCGSDLFRKARTAKTAAVQAG